MEFNPSENQYLLSSQAGLYLSNTFDEESNKLMLVKTGCANKICWRLVEPLQFVEDAAEEEERKAEVEARPKSWTQPVIHA